MSIKGRMIVMALAAVTGLTILGLLQVYSASVVRSATERGEELRHQIDILSNMRLQNIEMLLAAMDSIIDKAEGQVQPERQETIDAAVAYIRQHSDVVAAIGGRLPDKKLAASFVPSFDALAKADPVRI